mmetsp:Transcript_17851/g.39141  ORF Transcript_17851/g.39141 Transcript_17851/m.39141 type:complete len:263 (-) Transcript_17851:52-840(-)
MAFEKAAIGGAACYVGAFIAALCFVLACPVEIPGALLDGLPMTAICYDILVGLLLVTTVALVAGQVAKDKDPQMAKKGYILASACGIVSILLALQVLVYSYIFCHVAVPYIWNGIPGVMEKGFRDQCHDIPHKEYFGKVLTEGCPHQCAYGIGEMAGFGSDAAVQASLAGGIPTLTIPQPKYNGMSEPPGVCVSDEEYDQMQEVADHEGELTAHVLTTLISTLILSLFGAVLSIVGLVVEAVEGRESAKVDPLTGVYEQLPA